ncbi:SMP-30/gluconolactonase/LRE family protein [Chitinophaga sp. GCM10012297]|uniref:SMP-30/gluconolactonase/LRE family protein n=1 Tax=Chitinophaga chungangae TaxID=2821488 RepID=A0ABS3YKX8_9BACT|nr:SMP-30/gluconolactonase/LRE family protein [Chitinophaga chungangae]MBO9155356.1 SMP-30/gluconolactonase/LRE family protein [Chitinophaga chungangae]
MTTFFSCIFIMILSAGAALAQQPAAVVEKMHPDLDAVIATDAEITVIADGFEWVEGPVWVEKEKMLLFSDVMKNRIYKWTAKTGVSTYLEPSGYTQAAPRGEELGSNGLALNAEGQLVLCQHGDRRIAVMNTPLADPKPMFATAAGKYDGKKFNSPNDLAIASNGDMYFTDPPYGLEKGPQDPARELPYHGVYRIAKNGKVSLLLDSLTRPNGIAFFPGEKSLLIANSDPGRPHWYRYDIDAKGNLANGRIFFNGTDIFAKENRSPDGIKINKNGIVFAPGPGGVWIINKEGEALGRIKTSLITSNCAFTADQHTLFVTADNCVLKVTLK